MEVSLKKIVSIVINNFKNDSRVLKENISLQNAGYDVQVVALWEEGVKEFETVQNIPVHRVVLQSKNWSTNGLIQLLKYFEFIYRVVKGYRDSDIVHCNDLNTLPVAVIIKKFFNKNVKIVYDAHEYETETLYSTGIRKKIAQKLEKSLIRYTDRVITVSETIANEYVRLYNIEKPVLVFNTPYYKEIKPTNIFREKFHISKEKNIFLYQGALSQGRGIEILLEAFTSLDENNIIIFMGYGLLEDHIKESAKKYMNIYFHEAVAPEEVLAYTSSANFGISTIEDSCLSYRYCLPNKMFEYMMAGLPVIVSDLPEMKKIIEVFNVGVVLHENSINGMKDAIGELEKLDKYVLKENLKQIKHQYNWEEQERKLLKVYNAL